MLVEIGGCGSGWGTCGTRMGHSGLIALIVLSRTYNVSFGNTSFHVCRSLNIWPLVFSSTCRHMRTDVTHSARRVGQNGDSDLLTSRKTDANVSTMLTANRGM